jgi:hypothetical protein
MDLQYVGPHHGNACRSGSIQGPKSAFLAAGATGRALICAYQGRDVKSHLPGHTC